ncbi:tRNA (guanine-N(7)-)-methyltransferase (tRNA(m7G46)-methyltransferase) [Cryptotrichosporon argae]
MPPPSNRVFASAALALLVSYVLHRLSLLQAILLFPLVVTFVVFATAVALIVSASRKGHATRGDLEHLRHALRPLSIELSELATPPQPPPRPSTKLEWRLAEVLRLVRESFILSWYARISPSPAFPNAIERIIRHALCELAARADAVDWPTLLVSRVVPLVTAHLQHYRAVEHLSTAPTGADLPLPLPARPHAALSASTVTAASALAVEAHFRKTLDRAVPALIPDDERTDVASILVREIVLGAALVPTFDMLCDSDFWNRQIDEKGGRYLHEQKQVNKFLSALSALPQPAAKQPAATTPRRLPPASISVHSSTRQFDDFMRSIPKLRTLGEARRLRADVERELRSTAAERKGLTAEVARDKQHEARARRVERYYHRLEKARSSIDARIASLAGSSNAASAVLAAPATTVDVNLYAVLSDPASLAYWLEYMERRSRTRLVQFWLTVEGFKDPLEAVGQHSALESVSDAVDRLATASSTMMSDTAFLYQAYFAGTNKDIVITPRQLETIKEFAHRTAADDAAELGPVDVRRAKQAVYGAQKAVYEQMEEEDWRDFERSELYLKAVADLKRAALPPPTALPATPMRTQSMSLTPPTSPRAPLPAPPIHPSRHMTAPLAPVVPRRASELLRRPMLSNGSITPFMASTSAVVSTTAPILETTRSSRVHTPEIPSDSLPPVPATPRGSNHLDFLISSEAGEDAGQRDKLFGDDDVDEDDEEYVQVQRMEAIQAALNEIMAADDVGSSRYLERVRTPDSVSVMSPSTMASPLASVVLKRPALGMSRSVEDLKTPRTLSTPRVLSAGTPTPSTPARPGIRRRSSLPKYDESKGRPIFADGSDDDDVPAALSDDVDSEARDVVPLAAPGDLQLPAEISRLAAELAALDKQDALLDALVRQAELTGNQKELKLLQRSQASVRRAQRTAAFQKTQYEQQEEANRLVPGRTRVAVPASVVADEHREKHVVRYTVEVAQVLADGQVVAAWAVARRYNEFWELDRTLREWAARRPDAADEVSRIAELPGKRLVTNMSASFVESRRAGLEKYLQSLVALPLICESPQLRVFLSRTSSVPQAGSSSLAPHALVKSIYKTMASSLDDTLGPNMVDMLSASLGRQINDVTGGLGGLGTLGGIGGALSSTGLGRQIADVAGGLGISDDLLVSALRGWKADGLSSPSSASAALPSFLPLASPSAVYTQTPKQIPTVTPAADAKVAAVLNDSTLGGENATGAFTAPICDLFIEVLGLKENNWLRRQAIVVILQQVLGGTIERKVRDAIRAFTSPDSVERTLAGLQETLWPNGARRSPSVPRTDEDRAETRAEAARKLAHLIPDVAANMIGRSNARRAGRRVFGALQDRRLNQHIVLSILDELFGALFPPPAER